MPNKTKSRNNSRKSTASSHEKLPLDVTSDEDFVSILMVKKPSSRKTTPKEEMSVDSPRPEFMEPLSPKPLTPPPTSWQILGMPEPEYWAMTERFQKMYREIERKNYEEALLNDLNRPRFWEDRIEKLEKEREYFNRKGGWSAIDMACVDRIDAQIQECEIELDRIYAVEERLEVEYD